MTDAHDDAPAATSKRRDAADTVTESLIEGQGSSVVGRSVTINRPASELYAYFRDFTNLPHFMENVVSIEVTDDKVSHWTVKAPAGATVEWDARVTQEEPDRFIAWTSEPGADVANSGRIEFRDAGERGTVVTVTIAYDPPGGVIGKVIAKMFQREPAIQARRDLRRFKQLMETGEIATPAMNPKQYEEMGL
ncbi:SRPBCC family protein [Sphingomonas sp. Leaf37]|uniref:SRPBCC family protein n=1 Tax=Sphingomonas sp. Leaf37 TaxID=2876552 RepID=UPI001E4AE98E|nr:SRPBCC family protein [Sphingomonas sp. Leaf37]